MAHRASLRRIATIRAYAEVTHDAAGLGTIERMHAFTKIPSPVPVSGAYRTGAPA